MEKGFKIAFEAAWEAYKSGTIPIGACILNEKNDDVAIGKNQVCCEGDGVNSVALHQLAHAEINAVLQLSEQTKPNLHPNIRKYTLYAVMEPCPLCFGAIVMGSIRNVKFAARDGFAGAASLNDSLEYIKRKKINVEGPFDELEHIHIAIQTCYELENATNIRRLIDKWQEDCPLGVQIGEKLYNEGILKQFADENKPFEAVLEYIERNI